jgi:hypothetical protein
LEDKIWPDCKTGQENIRTNVCKARKALRVVMKAANVDGPDDPIPAVDRGIGRTAWRLDVP